jgi:hypothetical protein
MNHSLPADVRVIDCHAHYGYYEPVRIAHTDAEGMLRVMNRVGVEKVCISSFMSIGPDYRTGNGLVAEVIAKHPERFIGYAVVNPNQPGKIKAELERCFDDYGMKAIKLHPALHRYPVEGPAYKKVFEFAAARRVPILSHEWGHPDLLKGLCREYREVSFIIAHAGFWDGRSNFTFADVVGASNNVFVDLAYSNIYYGALEQLVEIVGPTKILFGSDFPLHDLAYQLGRVLFAQLSDADKRMILGGNMLRLLGE